MEEWIERKVLISLSTCLPSEGRTTQYGHILAYHADANSIIFYDDDLKQTLNISLYQIEDMQPVAGKAEPSPAVAPQTQQARAAQRQTVPGKQDKQDKLDKRDLRGEAIRLIQGLTEPELLALLPLLQHMRRHHA